MAFQKATKKQAKLRMALIGPSGSGKTMTALKIATALGNRVALIDTERGSASKYADKFSFDTCELASFHPDKYIEAIKEAESGYDVLIIDSLSHAWTGKDGALELVDRAAKRQSGNSFGAWRDVTPLHNALVDAIVGAKCHIIATMRSKTEYVQEKNAQGKTEIRKVGMAPVQRDGLEYEFDVVGDLDFTNNLIISKSRCEALTGAQILKAGPEVAATLQAWLTDGAAVVELSKTPEASRPIASTGQAPAASKPQPNPADRHARLLAKCDQLRDRLWDTFGILIPVIPETSSEDRLTELGKALRTMLDRYEDQKQPAPTDAEAAVLLDRISAALK